MSETKEQENIIDESAIEGDSQHVLGEETRFLILDWIRWKGKQRSIHRLFMREIMIQAWMLWK
jgi:hypothetical protein